jgi:hypothetical protein
MLDLFKRGGIFADETKVVYVVMNHDKTTLLIDPTTGGPYWSHSKEQADIKCVIMAKDFGSKGCFAIPHIEALKILAFKEECDLQPPYTYKNICKQLQHSHLRNG